MSDLALDDTHDLLVQNADLSLVKADDAIDQDLDQSLQFWLGEWFLDTTKGIPYRQRILMKNPNLDEVQAILINAALSVNGVTDINSFTFSYTNLNRGISVNMVGKTTNGQVIKAQTQIGAQGGQT